MRDFNIRIPDQDIAPILQENIDNLTKPKGSLGMLEYLAYRVGVIQQKLAPKLQNPHHIVFAADHGITDEKVSLSPKEVTYQMVVNFQQGGAGVNFLARQHGIQLELVDAGVDFDFTKEQQPLINKKIGKGTKNYLYEAAMNSTEADLAIEYGAECVDKCHQRGCNIISFGEMGISNTSSSSMWMHYLTDYSLKDCVGAGCDHTGGIVAHKYDVLSRAAANYKGDKTAYDVMCYFGGYEMVMTVGAMLRAAELGMIIVIDGFIMSACALMASKLNDNFLNYVIFGHQGDESGHKAILDEMSAKPILHLGFRLGEGTGALCAYPIIDSAIRMINEMASFKKIEVTKYF